MAVYRHTALVTRPGAGHRDESEAWVPGGATVLYDGPCDAQDGGYSDRREDDGGTRAGNRGWVFLPREAFAELLGFEAEGGFKGLKSGDAGDLVTVVFPHRERTARLIEVQEDDAALGVEWLR